jgi:hypothetical protein
MKTHRDILKALLPVVLVFVPFTVTYGIDDSELLIPAKTKLSLQLLSPISTATSKKGDKFSCKILTPAEYAGAIAEGHVRNVKRSGKTDKDSKIDLAFDRVTMLDGRIANFNATVIEVFDVANVGDQGRADNEGSVRNKSTAVKTSIKRAATGAIIGAIIGGVVAGGQGAAVGAAIGATVGVTTTLATKGPDLDFRSGTQFTVETNGPSHRTAAKSGDLAISAQPSSSPPLRPPTAASTASVSVPVDYNKEQMGRPVLKGAEAVDSRGAPIAREPPRAPSSNSRTYIGKSFRANVPDNWGESSNGNAVTLAPEGGYSLNKGRPELTHGVIIGMADLAARDLQEASSRFVDGVLKNNSYLHRQADLVTSMIGDRTAFVSALTGRGMEGRMEIVTVHTTFLSPGKIFYTITVVPEVESSLYREAFNSIVRSIQFVN